MQVLGFWHHRAYVLWYHLCVCETLPTKTPKGRGQWLWNRTHRRCCRAWKSRLHVCALLGQSGNRQTPRRCGNLGLDWLVPRSILRHFYPFPNGNISSDEHRVQRPNRADFREQKVAHLMPVPRQLFGSLIFEGEMTIMVADTNVGKSIFAVQISNEIAKEQVVLYLDLELSDKQFERRYSDNFENQFRLFKTAQSPFFGVATHQTRHRWRQGGPKVQTFCEQGHFNSAIIWLCLI